MIVHISCCFDITRDLKGVLFSFVHKVSKNPESKLRVAYCVRKLYLVIVTRFKTYFLDRCSYSPFSYLILYKVLKIVYKR